MSERRFVYILRSDTDPHRHYVGITSDVEMRLEWHNNGPSGVTAPRVVQLRLPHLPRGSLSTA